jgi:hypothetical protein
MSLFVVPSASSTAKAEGWAHVMDSQRATAVAVDGFGRGGRDVIEANGSGDLQLERHFIKGHKGPKTHRFWLHFVKMPVQVGALTSAQSMQSPLVVEVQKEK